MSGDRRAADHGDFLGRKLGFSLVQRFVAVDAGLQRGFEIRVPSVRSEPGEAQLWWRSRGEFEPEMIEDRIEEFTGRGVDQTVQDQEPGVAAQLQHSSPPQPSAAEALRPG